MNAQRGKKERRRGSWCNYNSMHSSTFRNNSEFMLPFAWMHSTCTGRWVDSSRNSTSSRQVLNEGRTCSILFPSCPHCFFILTYRAESEHERVSQLGGWQVVATHQSLSHTLGWWLLKGKLCRIIKCETRRGRRGQCVGSYFNKIIVFFMSFQGAFSSSPAAFFSINIPLVIIFLTS